MGGGQACQESAAASLLRGSMRPPARHQPAQPRNMAPTDPFSPPPPEPMRGSWFMRGRSVTRMRPDSVKRSMAALMITMLLTWRWELAGVF